ncbi:MAG: hypothetical protein H6Q90_5309 [Deltaproteobacteria bacterium]|nr:hypothetical protein [Deltaproteobacteria bacterium]
MACPGHDQICEFVARTLPAGLAAHLDAHLADCDDCRNLVFALASEQVDGHPDTTCERIGRFELQGVIGQGAMGMVYRARDPELDRVIAVKIRRGRTRLDAGAEERLRREARALARLTHPHVVTVYETGRHDGVAYIAMEHVDGVTLDEWLTKARSHGEILQLLAGAGRGLAAAHAVGLVHRDFKPRNVFVSGDGVAKVGDFGLVRFERVEDLATGATSFDADLAVTLSAGSLVGTPAYMAPEQLRGELATEATDQFSFCVTLYEALFGRRPFAGSSVAALRAAIERGPTFPSSPGIPTRLRRALARGLQTDPQRRFSSMTALLDSISRRSTVVRWVAVVAAASLAATTIVIARADPGASSVAPCSGADAHARLVWSPDRSSAIERAFAATKLPYAVDASTRVRAALDKYTATWVDAHQQACEAGQRAEHSAEVLDLRMQCLGHRLDDLRAVTGVLVEANEVVVRRATRAVEALPPIERCLDLDVVLAGVRPPEDPATRTAVETVRRSLAVAHVQLETGRFAEALESVRPLVDRARALAYQPLLAEVLLELGRAQSELEHGVDATAALDEAARTAYAAGHDEVAAHAWTAQVYTAYQRSDLKAGTAAAELARAALARVPHSSAEWYVQLLSYEGVLLHERGDYKAARDKHREALALATKRLPAGDDHLATVRNNLANTLVILGDRDAALALIREAIAIRERGVGADHPDTATNRGNLARQLAAAGRHAEALDEFDRAIGALERSVGPEHPALATVLSNSCSPLQALGRVDEALARARRALAIFEQRPGKSHPVTASAMTQVAGMLAATKHAAESIPLYHRALAIQEASLGPGHPNVSTTLNNLGFALLDTGDPRTAITHFERGLAIVETALGRDHHRVAYSLVGLGKAWLDSGQPPRAAPVLRRAVTVLEAARAVPAELGEARFQLARALWHSKRDRTKAKALAVQAIADFTAGNDVENRTAVETWSRHHE